VTSGTVSLDFWGSWSFRSGKKESSRRSPAGRKFLGKGLPKALAWTSTEWTRVPGEGGRGKALKGEIAEMLSRQPKKREGYLMTRTRSWPLINGAVGLHSKRALTLRSVRLTYGKRALSARIAGEEGSKHWSISCIALG